MLRGLMMIILGAAGVVIALPFVMTSRALDQHGITIPGRVYHKSEYVTVHYSGWQRRRDVTIEHKVPETGSVSYFMVRPDEQHYDALRLHQTVEVRYLPRRDVPDLPLSHVLWEIHALPTTRLVNVRDSRLQALAAPDVLVGGAVIGGLIVIFVLWRITRAPVFAWAAGLGILAGAALLFVNGLPRATRPPSADVRHASGVVKSVDRIDMLLNGTRSRGVPADQPIDVVGVEFVPQGRTESVLAVDLIDRASVAGLREQATVTLRYEEASPRTAYIDGARRTFPQRNFSGVIVLGVECLALLVGILTVAHFIGRGFKRLTAR